MKAMLWLSKDHQRIQELFEKYRQAPHIPQNGMRAAVEDIRRELALHLTIENEVFYDEVRNSSASKNTMELVDALIEEHQGIEKLLQEINYNNGNEKQVETKLSRLIELVEAHIKKEEDELFPEAQAVLSKQRLEELGLDMEYRKKIFTQAVA